MVLSLWLKITKNRQFFLMLNSKTISKLPIKFITWITAMVAVLIFAHTSNNNPQTIGKWIPAAKRILNFDAPLDNWYGPTAALLMAPFSFLSINKLFLITLFYFILGSVFYYKLVTVFLTDKKLNFIGLTFPFLNLYLFRLIDSSPDTVFEYFILTLLMWALIKRHYILFLVAGILLSELRSGYWLLTLVLAILIFLKNKDGKGKICLLVFPSLLTILLINLNLYGIFAPASEGARTAYFSNNKYAYLLESSYQIDHFFDGVNGPMQVYCKTDKQCNESLIKDIKSNLPETVFSIMNKIDTYFFSVQKVPRLPGWYELDSTNSRILIGESNVNWVTALASSAYFIYKSILHLSLIMILGLYLFYFRKKERNLITLNWLFMPWLIGAVPAVLFFAESRVWIVSELLLVPFILQTFQISKQNMQKRPHSIAL